MRSFYLLTDWMRGDYDRNPCKTSKRSVGECSDSSSFYLIKEGLG